MFEELRKNDLNIYDFISIRSIPGFYIANVVENKDNVEVISSTEGSYIYQKPNVRTIISYDDGFKWNYLPAPKTNFHGNPISCRKSCQLNILMYSASTTSIVNDVMEEMIAKKDTIGIVLGIGNIGKKLAENVEGMNTYLSIDGGNSW